MNEQAINKLMQILNRCEEPVGLDWPKHEQEEVIFSRWVIEELLTLVCDRPWTPASETIERFALKMEVFTAEAELGMQRRIFSIAAETAWEMLEMIK